jgi:hypothetical protein
MVGQGNHLDLPYRSLIYAYAKEGKTAKEIHDVVFRNSAAVCTLNRVQQLVSFFRNATNAEIKQYVNGDNTRKKLSGCKRKYGDREDKILLRKNNEDRRRHLRTLAKELYNELELELDAVP